MIETAKTIITRNTSPDLPFDRSINPYRGCEHGCMCSVKGSNIKSGFPGCGNARKTACFWIEVVLSAGTCTSARNRRIRGVWPLRGAVQWLRILVTLRFKITSFFKVQKKGLSTTKMVLDGKRIIDIKKALTG
jgi:hypothetical protein